MIVAGVVLWSALALSVLLPVNSSLALPTRRTTLQAKSETERSILGALDSLDACLCLVSIHNNHTDPRGGVVGGPTSAAPAPLRSTQLCAHFLQYLKTVHAEHYLAFWLLAEEFRMRHPRRNACARQNGTSEPGGDLDAYDAAKLRALALRIYHQHVDPAGGGTGATGVSDAPVVPCLATELEELCTHLKLPPPAYDPYRHWASHHGASSSDDTHAHGADMPKAAMREGVGSGSGSEPDGRRVLVTSQGAVISEAGGGIDTEAADTNADEGWLPPHLFMALQKRTRDLLDANHYQVCSRME